MLYKFVLSLHILTASISISLFLLRSVWSFNKDVRLQLRWVKILPHVNDTLLLSAGITLAIITLQNPVEQAWLMAKIVALVIYILLGMMVLKGCKNNTTKIIYLFLSVCCFVYIVLVAISKSPTLLFF
jgi:uncharacterized membrane protein SirB2